MESEKKTFELNEDAREKLWLGIDAVVTAANKAHGTWGNEVDPFLASTEHTPSRVVRAFEEMLAGYAMQPGAILKTKFYTEDYDGIVLCKDIEFFSLCEHHLLPFYGVAHVAYIADPGGKVVGLSKLPRLVDLFARRLQMQERMTRQIATAIEDSIKPKGVAVIVKGTHLCSKMRGVGKQHSSMVTSTMLGAFRDNPSARSELLALTKEG